MADDFDQFKRPAEDFDQFRVKPAEQDPTVRAQLEAQDDAMRAEGELDPAHIQPDISPTATFLEHAGNKAGFGIVPALTGAATAGISKFQGDPRPFGDIYRRAVQGTRSDLARGEQLNPGAATAGKALGVGSTLLLPAGRIGQGVGAAARTAAGVGAIYGGVGGLAGGEGLATLNPKQAALDTGIGAGTGAVTGAALGPLGYLANKGLSPVARYIGGKLQSIGNSAGLRAIGSVGSDIKNLGNEQLQTAAAEALQREGVIKPLGTIHGNAARVGVATNEAGQQIGSALQTVNSQLETRIAEASAHAGEAPVPRRFNTGDLASAIGGAQGVLERTPGVLPSGINKLAEQRASILNGGPQDLPLPEANALKSRLQELADIAGAYGPEAAQTDVQRAMRGTAAAAREHVLSTAGQVPGGREQLEQAFSRYGPMADVGDIAARRSAMTAGHSRLGMVGGQLLGAGLQSGLGGGIGAALAPEGHRREGALYGLAAGLAQKPLREMGTSLLARSAWGGAGLANRLASGLEGAEANAGSPVTRYIAGLLSRGSPAAEGAVRQLSPSLEGSAGGAVDQGLTGRPVSGGNDDNRHP